MIDKVPSAREDSLRFNTGVPRGLMDWQPAAQLKRSTALDVILTLRRHRPIMAPMTAPKRATVYFEPEIHKALRLRAAANDRSISDIVNEAVRVSLAEDAADLSAFDKRKRERSESFDSFVQGMKRRGLI